MGEANAMIILAVDPGASGGIAIWDGVTVHSSPNPKTEGDWVMIIHELGDGVKDKVAVIEKQSGFLGKGRSDDEGANTGMALRLFSLGESYGFLRGVIQGAGWRTELVAPQKWQKALSLGGRRNHATRTLWKNHCKAMAQRLYPGQKVTLAVSDALLILEYAKRTHLGQVAKPQGQLL